jgi:O-antigen/teichoic acid export membrane protein
MIFKDKFFKDNILMFFSSSAVSVTNLLYQMLMVRKLDVAIYGSFNSLLSIFTIISLPAMSLCAMIAKFTSAYNSTGQEGRAHRFISVIMRHMFFIGILFLGLYVLLGSHFKNYLQLDSIFPVYLVGCMLFVMTISTVALGAMQGFEKFIWYSIGNLCGAIIKLAFGFLFVLLGWSLLGALGAYLISQLVILSIIALSLKDVFRSREDVAEINIKEKYKFVLPAFVTFACVGFLTNMDVVLVKHFFGPIEAGYYSVAQMVGKIALFIPGAIYLVMLPHTSGLHAQRKDPRGALQKSLLYTVFLCLCFVGVYNVFPRVVLTVLCGKFNNDIIFLGRLFSIIMTFFSLLIVLLLYQLSVSRFRFLKIVVPFSILQILAIILFHNTMPQVLYIMFLNSAILFLLNLRLAFLD